MGARHAELALGLWLVLAPFVFGHSDQRALLLHDVLLGTLAMVLPLLCYHRPLHRAHLLLLPLGGWLVAFGWWTTRPGETPAAQNHLLVGLLLLMLAIVPSRAVELPTGWRRFLARTRREGPPAEIGQGADG